MPDERDASLHDAPLHDAPRDAHERDRASDALHDAPRHAHERDRASDALHDAPRHAAPDLELERVLLAPWRAACARVLGQAPTHAHDGRGPLLKFPHEDSPVHAAAIGRVRIYADAVRHHLRALGYDWDAHGVLATVPTPLSLRHRLRALGCGDAGFTPEYHRVGAPDMPTAVWLARQCAGGLPIAIGTPGFYRRAVVRRALGRALPFNAAWQRRLHFHLHGVQHDMTKHALCLHLVPAAQVRAIGARVREAWAELGAWRGLAPLSRFYESDLTGYCQAIWRDLPAPAAFAPTFNSPANLARLHAALDLRIAQARRAPPWIFAALRRVPEAPARFDIERPSFTSPR